MCNLLLRNVWYHHFNGKRTRTVVLEPTREGELVEDDEITLRGFTPLNQSGKFSDKTKLGQWLIAAGVDIDDDTNFDTDDLVGRKIGIFVEQVQKDKGVFCNVTKVYPAKKARKTEPVEQPRAAAPKAAPKPQAAPVEDEGEEEAPVKPKSSSKPQMQAKVEVDEEMFDFEA